jgi:hypothetical protein
VRQREHAAHAGRGERHGDFLVTDEQRRSIAAFAEE